MQAFTIQDRERLVQLLVARGIMSDEVADTFTHALLDINESTFEIYDQYLPRLVEQLNANVSTDELKDTIWDIREACRHIDYQLKDAKLPPGS